MITWKQFVYRVEQALEAEGVDPKTTLVDITYMDVLGVNVVEPFKDVTVVVNTGLMPRRAQIIVEA